MGIVYLPAEDMWDTWIYQDGNDYHLFFLSGGDIGRAVSTDLIHWRRLPSIRNMASAGDWDEAGMVMTGSVAKVGDSYYLCYGSGAGTPIGFLVSTDLLAWQRYSGKPVLPSKAPYTVGSHWRDLSAYYDEEDRVWHGYLFAIDQKSGCPAIALVTSGDYLEWSYQEPVFVSEPYSRTNNGFVFLEVPDYFRIGDSHYLLFSSVRSRKQSTSGRTDAAGTWYLVAEKKEGPWRVPERPLLLGSGRGRFDHYVGRTTVFEGQRLLYHHTWGRGKVSWATPKLINSNPDGSLGLRYWPRLDTLITKTALNVPSLAVVAKPGAPELTKLDIECSDFMFTCTIDFSRADEATLLWHLHSDLVSVASGLQIDLRQGSLSMTEVRFSERSIEEFNGNTYLRHLRDDIARHFASNEKIAIRIISRAHQVEVYVDDAWVFSMDMSDLPASGGFGFLVDSGELRIENVVVSELEELQRLPGATR
jgi:beta-fructofuranosidase